MYSNLNDVDIEHELAVYREIREKITPCVHDATFFLYNMLRTDNKFVIIEGANAAMLDIDFGTYPYVTSSTCTIGGICSGLGLQPKFVGDVIAIVKAYTTRVGLGAFASELLNETGEYLQRVGKEVGVTTGRKRRCGWLDLVVVKYSNMINGYTALAITKLDVLDQLSELKIAVAYKYNGKILDSFPANMNVLEKVEVEYVSFEGWKQSISDCRNFESLPENAKKYIQFIETFLEVPVRFVGVGKERESVIEIKQ